MADRDTELGMIYASLAMGALQAPPMPMLRRAPRPIPFKTTAKKVAPSKAVLRKRAQRVARRITRQHAK